MFVTMSCGVSCVLKIGNGKITKGFVREKSEEYHIREIVSEGLCPG